MPQVHSTALSDLKIFRTTILLFYGHRCVLLKLNIGCGLEYKKGYVNVDAYNDTVADRVMSVTNLEFESRSFSHVDCIQVVEHLGAAKSIYSVSEIYRVLKPEGTFLLETPDLISSFKNFIKGNEDSRKLIMNWIYGLDMPGMWIPRRTPRKNASRSRIHRYRDITD